MNEFFQINRIFQLMKVFRELLPREIFICFLYFALSLQNFVALLGHGGTESTLHGRMDNVVIEVIQSMAGTRPQSALGDQNKQVGLLEKGSSSGQSQGQVLDASRPCGSNTSFFLWSVSVSRGSRRSIPCRRHGLSGSRFFSCRMGDEEDEKA